MKLIVSGSRNCTDDKKIFSELDRIHRTANITLIIHGGARGVDALAGLWATNNNIPVQVYPADWVTFGRAAGPIRNKQMLDSHPDRWIAFPSEDSRGTKNFITQAMETTIPGQIIYIDTI